MTAPPTPLPPLREEIDLLDGPRLHDGQPSWVLHDPVRNQFFQIDWPSFEILHRWHLGDAGAIAADITANTTLSIEADDVARLTDFLEDNQLLQPAPGTASRLAERLAARRGGIGRWLLHNYLFFRVPLIKPDRWLSLGLPWVAPLFSRRFLHLTLAVGVLGLLGIYREWEHFSATLVDLLTWGGLVAYGITLAAVKLLHELGHAFTAKRYGCRVPTMGVAFLVLWPVAYTDTNEVWKLTSRSQRVAVAAAGIATETAIAAWATLAWVLLPEGMPKSLAFLLCTTTLISTLAINASPFMRFDGYFLLSDWLGMPNLHGRAFALARWHLRETLFALGAPPPESLPPRRQRGLIVFAWATWMYRLVVFLSIAALVYHFFIKLVGILLFLVEILWFVLLPVWSELRIWLSYRDQLRRSQRARCSAWLAAAALLLFVLPWPTRIGGSGLLQPAEQLLVYAPGAARLAELPVANGGRVAAGALLLRLESPELALRAGQSEARLEGLAWQSAAAGFDAERRRDWQVLGEQLAGATAEAGTVDADAALYAPIAPFSGVLRDVDPDLRPGDWVGRREFLARLVSDGPRQVVTYVDEDDIRRIAVGDRAVFVGEGPGAPSLRLSVATIEADAARTLSEPELAAPQGGHVPVRERQGHLYPERAVYRVRLAVHDPNPPAIALRGHLSIAGNWEAPGLRFLRAALATVWRESGF